MKKGRHDVIYTMLKEAKSRIKKTVLMHRANMSSEQIGIYLPLLVKKELMEELLPNNGDGKMYKTTQKGMEFLETYNLLDSFIA